MRGARERSFAAGASPSFSMRRGTAFAGCSNPRAFARSSAPASRSGRSCWSGRHGIAPLSRESIAWAPDPPADGMARPCRGFLLVVSIGVCPSFIRLLSLCAHLSSLTQAPRSICGIGRARRVYQPPAGRGVKGAGWTSHGTADTLNTVLSRYRHGVPGLSGNFRFSWRLGG